MTYVASINKIRNPIELLIGPVVILEAVAAALQTVATIRAGIPSVIEDGENGRLLNSVDYHAMAERIHSLCFGNTALQCMGLNA